MHAESRRRCPGFARSSCGRRQAERERLRADFVRLCEIPSPSRRERAAADYVTRRARARADRGRERAETGADAGNLYARIPGPEGAPTVLFCAHLDTVPLTGPIEVQEVEGRYTNRLEAILGADNKAAVAAFMGVARRFARRPAGRARVPVHDVRGGRAPGREGVRPRHAAGRLRLRLRPRVADRRADRRRADLLPDRGRVPRPRRARRHPARGRAQRDRGGGEARSTGCSSGGSTTRRPRTWAGSTAARPRTSWRSAAGSSSRCAASTRRRRRAPSSGWSTR